MNNDERKANIYFGLGEHLGESLMYFDVNNVVGIFLQGSQNYGLDTLNSDIDTKLIVTPRVKELALNEQSISRTHVRDNEEHTDWKDVRLYMETFRKQNLNFLEILFTDFYWINPIYEHEWNRLVAMREDIAHMNPGRAVMSMKGLAQTKYKNIERFHPTHADIFEKYHYNPKEVSHLVRIRDYIDRYITGESYKSCMTPKGEMFDLIMNLKLGKYSLEEVRKIADENITHIEKVADKYFAEVGNEEDVEIRELLNDVQHNIIRISLKKEIEKDAKEEK